MPKMRAVQVSHSNGPFELVERDLPEPGRSEVRVKVQACGICHSDSFVKEGTFPGITYPRVPGHEIAGVIDALGPDVSGWRVGQRVGVGWFGGHCGRCEPCRRGRLIDCRNLRIPGITYDGGYAEAMVTPAESLALIPDDLAATDAAPLLCAGVTTYNALRQSGAMGGDVRRDSRVLDRELCGAVESNFHAASFSCSYHLLMAVSAARMDLAMGSTGLAAAGEMMASAGRSERL